MVEHIDSNRLHNDLRYHFEYLFKFMDFTSDDIHMLNTFEPIVLPLIPVIVDSVYRKIFFFDIVEQQSLVRNDGFLSKETDDVVLNLSEMKLCRDVLSIYLKRILTQRDWNANFLQYLSKVGKMHTNHAGSSSVNVDYIHITALLGYLEQLLIDTLLTTESIDETTKGGILTAINKFFWIQNEFFTMYYFMSFKEHTKLVKSSSSSSTRKCKCCWM